jgi:eukaryotic-like serine/threonine-protein kinase
MLSSGQLLADRYRLVRRIAVGGMGEVWEATDSRLDRAVAIKILKPELSGNAEFLHRFRTEARTTASLNHPGIAAVHDYGETASVPDGPQDTAYLVMELVEGDPLAALLAKEGRLNADRTLDLLQQAGTALQAAHERGYVHRDIKPGNILVTPAGQVKVTDFGIAKAADAAPVTRSGMVMGTAHYIAPEQAVGQDAEPASDVYALATVGYECLAGRRPFLSENAVTVAMMHIREIPPPLPPDVPPGARALIEATLVKDPRQRYRSGGEFAAAVGAVRAGLPLPTPSGLAVAGPMHPHPAYVHNTSPPNTSLGAIPVVPQQLPPASAPPSPGTGTFLVGPSPQSNQNRVGLWVLLVVLVVVLVGLLTAWGVHAWLSSGTGGAGSPGGPGAHPTVVHPTAGVMGGDLGPSSSVTVGEAGG